MSKVLRKTAVYPYPPECVWVALTDRRALAEWLMPNDFDPVVGRRFRFQVDPMPGCGDGLVEGEVLEVDRPRRLAYTWNARYGKRAPLTRSTVVWTLAPEGAGTRLTLEHSGLETMAWWQRFMLRFGWGTMVKRWIPKVCGRVDADGRFTPGAIPLGKRCYKCKTIPAHLTR